MSKKKIIVLIILIIVYITIPVVIYTIYKNNRNNEIKIKEEKEQNTLNFAKSKVKIYLKQKYNKDFRIELESKGYKSLGWGVDDLYLECGHDHDVLEYVFSVYADDLDDPFYVTVWIDKDNNDVKVEEVDGSTSNITNTSYDIYKKYEEDKKEIKDELFNIISSNYISYSIDDKSSHSTIFVTINDYLYEEYNKDTISKIIELLKNRFVKIKLIFIDNSRTYEHNSNAESEMKIINFYHDLYYYLKFNLNDEFSLNLRDVYFDLKINKDIKSNYSEYYEKIYQDLLELCIKYDKGFSIDFNDDHIVVGYDEDKTLKDLLHE